MGSGPSAQYARVRSRHSNDNAQAESKNGAIVRKHLGYSHIPQCFASLVNAFCCDHLNLYVNFHRPCLFAKTITDAKSRQRKRYPYKLMMTPYEKLKSLHKAEQFLKPGITFLQIDAQVSAESDNEAAQRLNNARARSGIHAFIAWHCDSNMRSIRTGETSTQRSNVSQN